VEGTEIK